MLTRIVRMEFRPEETTAFHDIFDRSKSQIRQFPGCLKLELLSDAGNPAVRYTLSVWESAEALEAYRQSELFARTWAATKALFGAKPQAFSLLPLEQIP